MLYCSLPLLLLAAQASARSLGAHGRSTEHSIENVDAHRRISPELEPTDDKKFFKKDYPFDKRPVADKHYVFSHPYPAVQDSGDFDKDFVKDENSDGGRWKAQMEYDTLRSKIREAKDKLNELEKKMDKEKEEWMKAKKAQDEAETAAAEANQDTAAAKKAADKAADKVNRLEGSSSADGTKIGGAVGDAVKDVQKEMKDLEDCRKKLAEAKARMKRLMKEKDEMDKKKKQLEDDAVKADAAKKAGAPSPGPAPAGAPGAPGAPGPAGSPAASPAGAPGAAKSQDESTWNEEQWQDKLDKEKAQHAKAQKSYEEEVKELKKTEDELARAADNLRKYRRPPYVDDDGGVYNVPRSHARVQQGVLSALAITVVALFGI